MIQSKRKLDRKQSISRPNLLRFEKSLFNLINVGSGQALRIESKAMNKSDHSARIMGTLPNKKSVSQLWKLKFLNSEKYQIIHYETDDVIDAEDDEVKLERGKSKYTQKIQIQILSWNQQIQVKFKDCNGFYLTLDGILTLSKEKHYDELQRFYMQAVQNPYELGTLRNTYNIMKTPYCLDVENATRTPGPYVTLYEANIRGNQRWLIDPPLREKKKSKILGHRIQNFVTHLYLILNDQGYLEQGTQCQQYIWVFENEGNKENEVQYDIFCEKNGLYLDSDEDNRLVFKKKNEKGRKWAIVS